ncbi:MAG: beta-ketoacyl-[acyl-carrier-protein] synthase family protein [Polyangiaceae bacterium]
MRTWIVGLGVVSPLATGARATMRALLDGKRAQAKVTLFDVSELRAQLAAEVADLRIEDVAPKADAARWSRSDALALIAAKEALAEARVDAATPIDLVIGGTTGGLFVTEGKIASLHRPLQEGGETAAEALRKAAADESLRSHPVSATADRLFEAAHPFRRTRALCSACSSSANAIALADMWIRSGKADRVIAGGTDALCRLTYVGFNLLQAMDPSPCRPFDAKRAGMNIGEGAAFLVLESEASARARGVTPIAELSGWAIGSEAHHITNPEATGSTAARLMRAAVARGGLTLGDVGYVNLHGTATPHNDRMEGAALADVFGARLADVHVSSSKGQIGHTLGAAGAIEAAITALAIADRTAPPTIGLTEPDPAIPALRHVRDAGVSTRVRAALSSSFGFGGSNTVLALAEPELFAAPPANEAKSRKLVVAAASVLGPEGVSDGAAAARYLAGDPAENVGAAAADTLAKSLDPDRARRLDRGAALVTAISKRALDQAGDLGDPARVGMLCGIAYRKEEEFAAFLAPVLEKGFRFGKPAVFPNLLLSSPAGHASIYLGLRGAAFTTNDVSLSAGTALASTADLLRAGEIDAAVACTVIERDAIVENVVGPRTYGPDIVIPPRSPAAAAFVLRALEDGAAPSGALGALDDWQDGADLSTFAPPPPPDGPALVVLPRPDARLAAAIDRSAWASARRVILSDRAGSHEGTFALAFAAALGAFASGEARAALVVDAWREPAPKGDAVPGRWAAFKLSAL